jgi:hypothetical protein
LDIGKIRGGGDGRKKRYEQVIRRLITPASEREAGRETRNYRTTADAER